MARPYGEAGEKLAAAFFEVGRIEEARETIDAVLRSSWRTADSFATAERIYRAMGAAQAADEWRREALRLNPRIFG